jgi:hypothetical protein
VAFRASRLSLALGAFALVASALPTQAQLGLYHGLFNSGERGAEKADACGKGKKGDKGRGIIGGMLGGEIDRGGARCR